MKPRESTTNFSNRITNLLSFIKDKTTLFFKNKAEAFRKNYSTISAKYVHAKNTTFIYKKLL